jgi:hypothetical protein
MKTKVIKTQEIIKNLIKSFSNDNANHWTYRSNIIKCLRALNIGINDRNEALLKLEKNNDIEAFETENGLTCYGLIEHESQKGNFYKYYLA